MDNYDLYLFTKCLNKIENILFKNNKMKEIYHLYNKQIHIPLQDFLKEKEKYLNYPKKEYWEKRYLYNDYEAYSRKNGYKKCFHKTLINHIFENEKLEIEWRIQEIEWGNDINWTKTEEYFCEEFKLDNSTIYFITTKKGFRRIITKK